MKTAFRRVALALSSLLLPSALLGGSPQMFGVNLSAGENKIGNPDRYGFEYIYPSNADLAYYKSKGVDLIRVPFLWERVQPELHQELSPGEMQHWSDLFDRIERHGMRIIPDMHNYARRKVDGTGYIIGQPQVPRSAYEDVWRRLATAWRDRGCIWAYGIMNEPFNMGAYTWRDSAQAAVNGIRQADMNHAILIPGDQWSGAHWWLTYGADLINVVDPANNRIFEAHQYFDRYDNGEYRGSYDSEGASPTVGVSKVRQFVEWCVANNVRGFVGEYGIPRNDPRWLATLENFMAYLKANGISGTYWAGGPWWSNDYQLDVTIRPDQDEVPQWTVLKNYASNPGTRHFPNFTWYSESIAAGEFGSQWISFASPGGTVTGNPSATSTLAFTGTRSLAIDYTLPAGGSGGGSLHIGSEVNVPRHIAANHVLSFYAKGTAGTSASVTLATTGASGAKINTGALTSNWRRFEIPLSSFLNASITATTQIPRIQFDVFPADGTARTVYIDLVTLAIPSSNTAPTISVNTSTGGTAFTTDQPITLVASATDAGGAVDLVEFFVDHERVGFDTNPPYQATVSFGTPGSRKLTAIAYDSFGVNTQSTARTLTISTPAPLAQTITFTAPPDQPFSTAPVLLSATASSGLPASFSLIAGPATLADNELRLTGAGTVTVRAAQPGNEVYGPAPEVSRSFVVSPNFELWRQLNFSPDELTNPTVSGPLATGLDGASNLLRYALGATRTTPDALASPRLALDPLYFNFTYERPVDAPDLVYRVEVSPDLASWTDAGVTHERLGATDARAQWRGRHPRAGAPRLFFRLKVETVP